MKYDIIVPIYNTPKEHLYRCLGSIAIQTVLKDINVILVDDCSSKIEEDIINSFGQMMEITYLKLEKNVGVGVARQIAYENSNSEYVMFLDSDDSLLSAFSVEILGKPFEEDIETQISMARFAEQILDTSEFDIKGYNLTWLHAKMFRRSFLDENNIKIPSMRYNEDVGFNLLAWACADIEKIKYTDEIVHIWHTNKDSITRNKDSDYQKYGMFEFVKVYIWAEEEKIKRNINNTDFSKEQSLNCLMMLYWYYIQMVHTREKDDVDYYNNLCKEYCKITINDLTDLVNKDEFNNAYLLSLTKCSNISNKFIPTVTIYDWLWNFFKEPI